MRTNRLAATLVAVFLAVSAAGATAQPSATPGTVRLSDQPFRLESVGLTLYLPEGAVAQTQRAGLLETVVVTPPLPDASWVVSIQTPKSENTATTHQEVAEEVLRQLLESVGIQYQKLDPKSGPQTQRIDTTGLVFDRNDALVIKGYQGTGSMFYVKLPRSKGEAPAIRGYTVFSVGGGRFVTFDLITTEPDLAKARLNYESLVKAAEFADYGAVAASRGVAIEAGITLMSRLSPADMKALVEDRGEQWYRLYKEASTGADADATELGYQHVKIWVGTRGELDPARDRKKWREVDHEPGYLVRIDARNLEGETIYDSQGLYFMSPDRSEEAWTLQLAIRQPNNKTPQTWVETGARSASSMNVSTSGRGQQGKSARPTVPDNGYLTQVESLILPALLTRFGEPREYGFYTYQSEFGNIRVRRDTLEQPSDKPGVFRLTTRISEDRPAQTALYTAKGELIRAQLSNGSIREPVQLQRLVELWKSKKLPMN